MNLISVVMPCRNAEKYLTRSIESVIGQTYKNWELICINDNSDDCTFEMLNNYSKIDKRIKVFQKDFSIGCAASPRNFALDYVEGDFIFMLDSDDAISKNLLKNLIEKQKETGADIVLPDLAIFYPDNMEKTWLSSGILKKAGKPNKKINRNIILNNRRAVELSLHWKIHSLALYKAKIIKKIKFDERGMNGDEYSTRLFLFEANKIAFSNGTYFYFQEEDSITKKLSTRLFEIWQAPYLLEKFLKENHFPKKEIKSINKKRHGIYKDLKEKYKENKEKFNVQEQEIIENSLAENYKHLFEVI